MAKDLLKKLEERNKTSRTTKTVQVTAEEMLTERTDIKETTIKLRITEKEKELWKQYAKGQPLSAFIRDNVNYNIKQGITADDLLKK